MRTLDTWRLIYNSIREDVPVMLLYVLESSGSSPGRQGFFMAVNARNEMEGSIGGGMMEHKFVEMAREKLRAASYELRDADIRKQIHDKSAAKNQSGMICSGEQTILLYPMSKDDTDTIEQIIDSLEQNRNGTLRLSPAGIIFSNDSPENNFTFSLQSEDDWSYEEKTGYKNQLSIIGGGHCALAFSKLMCNMDFYIRVYEDRASLNTLLNNDAAHEKIVVDDYTKLTELIVPGKDHYVVVMTFGYRTDDLAVRALIDKDFAYFGLLGSRTKVEKMMDEYKKEGIDPQLLQHIHAPVGLSIRSQTPEEIAISIAAEIIGIKNKSL